MSRLPSLATYMLVFSLTLPMAAEARLSSFAFQCVNRFASIFTSGSVAAEPMGPEILAMPVRRWLTVQQGKRAANEIKLSREIGDQIIVAGIPTEIVAVLGRGAEAEIYLVKTAEGFRTLKAFFKPEKMKQSLADLKIDFPLPSPTVFKQDAASGLALLEYVEGASVAHVQSDWSKMGLSETELNRILAKWRTEQDRIRAEGKFPPDEFNVVYSFTEDRFFRIDAI